MNKLLLVLAGMAISFCFAAINYAASSDLRAVQSGEVDLVCVMKDGDRTIDGSKVTGLMDDVWLFERGNAKNCRIIKGGDL